MDKELLKRNILEKIGGESEDSFLSFLKKISENLSEGEVIEIADVGSFQLKKEPLSRMERRGVGAEKVILIFLPIGGKSQSEVLTFDIDSTKLDDGNFNESVFDVGVNKPTIISESGTPNEKVFSNIIELIESSNKKTKFDLLVDLEQGEISDFEIKDPFDFGDSFDESKNVDESLNETKSVDESSIEDKVTEIKINEDFLSNDAIDNPDDDEFFEDDKIEDTGNEVSSNENAIEDEQEFDVVSSNIDSSFTDDDVSQSDKEIEMNKEVETAEINSAFTNEIPKVEEYDENTEEEINPFDELEDYIKDESKDEAQELIDEEPSNSELVNEENIEPDNDGSSDKKTNLGEKPKKNYSSYSAMRNKNSEWYKNPVLFIALFSAIIAIVVIIIFWPSNNSEVNVADGENILFDEQENSTESDKSVTNDVGDETVSETDKAIEEKLAEIKRVENSTPVEPKVSNPKPSKSSELYREIKNDKTITSRIYFDGELYTVQSSSWKSTTIAEREVNKLRKRGFDAFIYKVYIPTKGSTWNRVRIGYFNSQKEAEEFLKKNKI